MPGIDLDMSEEHIFSVSEFNEYVDLLLGQQLPEVVVEGEISSLNLRKNWVFITIADEDSRCEVFSFEHQLTHTLSMLEEGMLVKVYGRPGVHTRSGRFRIHAEHVLPSGEGALRVAYEKLQQKLAAEGLFEQERKRPIPFFPETIGLLTAPDSRAYSDFKKVLGERMGGVKILFYPVQVQGAAAVDEIVAGLEWFAQTDQAVDLLVITRGGGSLEDLAAFNTEAVVRAVYGSPIPVVAAVGHEADNSLVDLVADLRASTPSNAAELVVRHRDELTSRVTGYQDSIYQRLELIVSGNRERISRALVSAERFFQAQRYVVSQYERRVEAIRIQLNRMVADHIMHLRLYGRDIERYLQTRVNEMAAELDSLKRLLAHLNPQSLLERGYSVTRGPDGTVIKDVLDLRLGDRLFTQLERGTIESRVEKVKEHERSDSSINNQ